MTPDQDISQEIRDFLCRGFETISPNAVTSTIPVEWPSQDAINILVQRSHGRLAYPSTVLRYIGDKDHQPREQLDLVLSLDHTGQFSELDHLYHHILSTADRTPSLRIIGCILLTDQSFSALMIESLFALQPGEVWHILDPLHPLFNMPTNDSPILSYQISFSDFIFDQQRAGEFYIDPQAHHADLAQCCLRYIKDWRRETIFGPSTSVEAGFHRRLLGYTMNNWIVHCHEVKDLEDQGRIFGTFTAIDDGVWRNILFSSSVSNQICQFGGLPTISDNNI